MTRLLLADRVKTEADSFLAPLLPALHRRFDVRFLSAGPGEVLAEAIAWADIVWLEWCWDHAVWATQNGLLHAKPAVIRLHSIEAIQTDFPARVDWDQIDRLVTVSDDIASVVQERFPAAPASIVIPNGIDMDRFAPGQPDRFRVAWVGHLEPKKNPMLLLQIAHRLHSLDPRYTFHVAGAFTDLRTARYLRQMMPALGLGGGRHLRRAGRRHAHLVRRQRRAAVDIDVRKLRDEHRRSDGDRRLPRRAWLSRRRTALAGRVPLCQLG